MNLLVTSYLSISSVISLSKLDVNTANAILCQKLKYFLLTMYDYGNYDFL